MRLMKRLAICILAAAMAMSILTACGDDAPSAPADSTPSASQEEEKKDDPPKEEEDEKKDDENSLPKNWNDSKTKTYYTNNGISDTNIYVEGTWCQVDIDTGNPGSMYPMTYVAQGNKAYMILADESGTYKIYKNEAGEYFASTGGSWEKCTTSTDINTAKLLLLVPQVLYKVPEPYEFEAYEDNGYYYESVKTKWTTGSEVDYNYGYVSENKIGAIACKLVSAETTGYVTIPSRLSNANNFKGFPDL